MFVRNVEEDLPIGAASYPRRSEFTFKVVLRTDIWDMNDYTC